MAIMPKLQPGDLVELEVDNYCFLALVKKAVIARRRGESPMIQVEWCGLSPRIYPTDYLEERVLKLVRKCK